MRSLALALLLTFGSAQAWAAPAAAPQGASFGAVAMPNGKRYSLVRSLGHGYWSDTYEGREVGGNGRVAIKMMKPEHLLAHRPDTYDKELEVVTKARAASAAVKKSTSLMRIDGIGAGPEGQRALVMEYIEGGMLEAKARPAAESARLGIELLRGLRALHLAGYRHNDLHLGNVAVDPKRGTLRLLDVGNAEPIANHSNPWLRGFGAPEKQGVGVRTELYNAGAFVYFARTGTKPERGHVDLGKIPEPALRAVLGKALDEDPARRWPNAQAFLDALRPLATRPATN